MSSEVAWCQVGDREGLAAGLVAEGTQNKRLRSRLSDRDRLVASRVRASEEADLAVVAAVVSEATSVAAGEVGLATEVDEVESDTKTEAAALVVEEVATVVLHRVRHLVLAVEVDLVAPMLRGSTQRGRPWWVWKRWR